MSEGRPYVGVTRPAGDELLGANFSFMQAHFRRPPRTCRALAAPTLPHGAGQLRRADA